MTADLTNIRSLQRKSINVTCPCRVSEGPVVDLDLIDLSPRGFKAKMNVLPLELGQSVEVYLEGDDHFRGTVRRREDDHAGIEFDRELPATVYERLLHKFAPLG